MRWHTSFVLKNNLLPPGKSLFPLDAATVHLFLADLSLRKANKSSTTNAISALAWFSRFLGESSSALDAAPNRMIAAGDRRAHASLRRVSDVLTPTMFRRLMDYSPKNEVEQRARFVEHRPHTRSPLRSEQGAPGPP